jgi:ATP-binding cassette subfamily B protein
LKKLLRFFKPYWIASSIAIAFMFLELFSDLFQPALIKDIVDVGIENSDLNYILNTSFFMIAIALVGMIGGFVSSLFTAYVSQSFGTDLRDSLFKKVQNFSFSNLDQFKTSSLITRLTNDVNQVQNMVRMSIRMMVRASLLCIGGVIMAVLINQRLGLIFLVSIPVLLLMLFIVIRKGFPLFTIVQKKLDRVNGVMRENLAGVRVVKAFVRSKQEEKRFQVANEELMDITIKGSRIVALINPLMMLVLNLSIVAVIWFGGLQYDGGIMTVGDIMAFINYMIRIMNALMRVAMTLFMVSRAQASANRINEVFEADVDIQDEAFAQDMEIERGEVVFQEVSFSYGKYDSEPILKNISFEAKQGEKVAIIGAIGSGKSTLVQLIPRLYDVTEGNIYIDGKDIRTYKLTSLRNQIGMVLQQAILFSGSIKENLRWGRKNAEDEEIMEAARIAQAHDFVEGFTNQYDTLLGQKGVNVSGGQKQRLSIARALIKKPKILILDDSTSAVDVGTEAKIRHGLKSNMKCTTFVIAQRVSTVLDADKIIVLDQGEIVAQGSHNELIKTSAIYQDIFYSQLGREDFDE